MISCQEYDYIEIVCMYRYPVRLALKNASTIEGKALDTKRNEHKQECIQLNIDGKLRLVVLDSITKLDVLVKNPHFDSIIFEND